MCVKYITKYIKERYVKVPIRRDVYVRLKELCSGEVLSDCIDRLLSNITPNIGNNIAPEELCKVLEAAVRLANKHPEEPESRVVFQKYEEYCL